MSGSILEFLMRGGIKFSYFRVYCTVSILVDDDDNEPK